MASLNETYMFRTDTLRYTYVNRSALDNLGYTLEAMQALTPIDIIRRRRSPPSGN